MIPISYNARSLLVRKTTSLATALGIGLVVFVIAAAFMLDNGLEESLKASGSRSAAIVLRKGSDAELGSSIDTPTAALITAAPGVKRDASGKPLAVGEVVVVVALPKSSDPSQISNVQIRGVPDNVMSVRPSVTVVDGRPPRAGTDEVMIGRNLVGRFVGTELGKSFELKRNRPVRVVGVFEDDGSVHESEVWGDLDIVRTSFGRESMVSSVTVQLESPSKLDGFAAMVENDKQLGLDATREDEYYEKQSEGMSAFILGLGISFAILFAIGAMIGAMITMYGAVAQRSREIGTLRALGFSSTAILASFLIESIVLALAGGCLGLLAALCMGLVHFSMLNMSTWSEIVFRFAATPEILVRSLVIGGIMGLLGGLFPAIRAARMSPIQAMRD